MLNREQRETLRAIEEQLQRTDPGLERKLGGRRAWRRHWLALAVISAVVLVASIVVGYPTGGLFAVLGLLLSAWRLHWYPENLLTTIQPPGNRPR